MTIASSRRRRAWRIGSTLAALAGSVVVAVAFLASRRASQHRPDADGHTLGPTEPVQRPPSATGRPALAPAGQEAPPSPGQTPTALRAEPSPVQAPLVPDDGEPDGLAPNGSAQVAPREPEPQGPEVAAGPSVVEAPPRRAPQLVLLGASVALLVVVGALVATTGRDGEAGGDRREGGQVAARQSSSTTERPSTSSVDQLSANQAFTRAAERLLTAGSFGYQGLSRASDVSPVRPGPWVAVELTVLGEVDLQAQRVHELVVSTNNGVAETVTDGVTVWARVASRNDQLAAEPYEALRRLTPDAPPAAGASTPAAAPAPTGGGLLPGWLAATVDRREGPEDPQGRRTFRARLPAAVLGEIETERPPVDAEVVLVMDRDGDPARVEVTTGPAGPPLHLAFELTRLGQPLPIELPAAPGQPGQPANRIGPVSPTGRSER